MKKPMRFASVVSAFVLLSCTGELRGQEISSNELSADIVRVLSKDLFDINSVPYLQPMVEAFNATSNAGFYHSAHVPSHDTLYIRIGLRGMSGFVREDQRLYQPGIPTAETENSVASPLAILVANRVKAIFRRGIEEDSIQVPAEAATVLGSLQADFDLNGDYLLREIRKDPVYRQAVALGLDSSVIDAVILQLPGALSLPPGADIDRIMAAVPQVEVGALYGTELLLRYIPPIRLDTTVGHFTFWGVGLKHSISQHLPESVPLDLAVQFVYQQTSLSNRVGVTAAELEADAVIMNGNVHASYGVDRFIFYGGLALESTAIDATYTYTLPRQVQAQLGLITPIDLDGDGRITDDEFVPDPENGFPGDTKPQVSRISLDALSAKGTLGAAARFGPVTIALDYGIGSLNVLSAGVVVDVWGGRVGMRVPGVQPRRSPDRRGTTSAARSPGGTRRPLLHFIGALHLEALRQGCTLPIRLIPGVAPRTGTEVISRHPPAHTHVTRSHTGCLMDMKQQIGQFADRGFRTAWIILLLWTPHGVVHAQENVTRDSLPEYDTSRSTAPAFVADHLNAAFGMGTDHGWLGLNVGLGFLSIGELRAGLHCSVEPSLFELPLLLHLHIGATLPVDRTRIRVSLGPTYIDRPTAQLHGSQRWSQFILGSSITTTWLPFESPVLGLFLSASLMTDIPDNGDLLWNAGGGVSFGFHR